jgi:hypothetical protein
MLGRIVPRHPPAEERDVACSRRGKGVVLHPLHVFQREARTLPDQLGDAIVATA